MGYDYESLDLQRNTTRKGFEGGGEQAEEVSADRGKHTKKRKLMKKGS